MYPNIADNILARIQETIDQVEISACYRELLLSVVAEVTRKFSAESDHRIPVAFLPAAFTFAFGGKLQQTLGVTSAWFLLQISAHFLDKVEDQEVDEAMPNHNKPGIILNLTTGLIFTAEYILDHLENDGVDSQAACEIRSAFNRYIIRICGGQNDDLWFEQPDLALCWQIARLKSGLFFGLGCFAGARVMTNDPDCLSAAWEYGDHLGLIKQIVDDVESFIEQEQKKNDLITGKWTLPIAYSMEILPNTHAAELGEMLKRAPANELALKEAREKMVKAGALIYLELETMKYALEANKAITAIQEPNFNRKDLAIIIAQTAGMEEHDLS